MWGYPTGGRGNNIKNLLAQKQINKLEKIIIKYKNNKSVNLEEILKDMKDIKGLGLSTLSKFLYFLEVTFNGKVCVILDKRIIDE